MKQIKMALPAPVGASRYELVAWEFGESGPLAYLQAGLHADELPGVLVLHRLREALSRLEREGALRGRIRLLPLANPIGISQRLLGRHEGRFELGSGRNFNRGYPLLVRAGERCESLDEARALLLERLAGLQGRSELERLQQQLFGWALEAVGRRLAAGAILIAGEAGGMSFDDALLQNWYPLCGGAGWPVPLAVTVELRGQRDLAPELTEQDCERLLDLLTERGWLVRPLTTVPGDPVTATPLAGVEGVVAPVGGIVHYLVAPGQSVEAGQPLAELEDPASGERSTLQAGVSGLCYARVPGPLVVAGEEVIFIAGLTPLRQGELLGL
ncbi:succinylglutamate desuccinylase/aspartoacylase domain-containing protein [Aeromonas schubertii]|uniref:Succinylglutamate desuccinylase/Aspartoacylase catalytic domain-containing protein n=1 Tax=Aeromonas schubertii TaxID=652 RepID=A0A0S2SPL2_9GAMM|nr:succinylglutamate desuccinylase/aspartoacylase family protein [Aeromonas schubertii]ALP43643.1 hypothetical protein WL1483_4224 [Aeromonas schubertii]